MVRRYTAAAGKFDGLVIPGVGSFSVVPQLAKALGGKKAASEIKIPVLCICLGMQALFSTSEEAGGIEGLGLVEGGVRKLQGPVRLPQLGWNRVKQARGDGLFDGISDGGYFYFANSYAAFPKNKSNVLATTEYGVEFASAVRKENWWGVQFHPEKSGILGLRILENFGNMVAGRAA
jgi:glutamine amidotransferase